MNKYKEALTTGAKTTADKEVCKYPSPNFTNGRIIGTSGDKYIVEIKGEQYVMPSVNGATFELNKTVKVTQPNGATDVTGQYIIGTTTS